MAALSPYFRLRLGRGWPGGELLRFQGCRSVPGPSEFRLWCCGRGEPTFSIWSALRIAALRLAQGVPIVELPLVSRQRLSPFWLRAVAVFLFFWPSPRARVQSPTARYHKPPYVQCPANCGGSSIDYRACTLLLLPLGRRQSVTRLSTTSRLLLRYSLPSLLPSAARHSWVCFCCPVSPFQLLVLRPGTASSCIRLSSRVRVLSQLLGISVCRTKGLRAARSVRCCMHLLASLRIVVVWSLRSQARVWALTPSLMPPLVLWAALPGRTSLADWADVGSRLACLFHWDPTRASVNFLRLLGHRLLGQTICILVLPRMSLWGFGVSLLLPWLSSCLDYGARWM